MWSWILVPERGTLPHHFPSHAVSGPSPVVSRLLRAPPSLSTPQCPLLVVRSPPVCGCPGISGIRVAIDRDPAPGLPIGVLSGTSAPGCGRDRCHGCTSIIKVAASSGVPVVNDVSDSTRSKAGVHSLLRSVTSCPVCLSSVSFPLTQLVPRTLERFWSLLRSRWRCHASSTCSPTLTLPLSRYPETQSGKTSVYQNQINPRKPENKPLNQYRPGRKTETKYRNPEKNKSKSVPGHENPQKTKREKQAVEQNNKIARTPGNQTRKTSRETKTKPVTRTK